VTSVLAASLATPAAAPADDPVADFADRVVSRLTEHADLVDYLCRALVDAIEQIIAEGQLQRPPSEPAND
jgi:hypothetical protein